MTFVEIGIRWFHLAACEPSRLLGAHLLRPAREMHVPSAGLAAAVFHPANGLVERV